MGFLDVFTFLVFAVLLAVLIFLIVVLGTLPAKIARKRNHSQVDAINVASWIGILTFGVLWPVALVWAYYRPARVSVDGANASSDEGAVMQLMRRVEAMEKALARRESGGEERAS